MKQMTILFLLALTGCASNVTLKDAADTTQAMGTLSAWGPTHRMEVMLDGKRYEGESVRNPCTTDAIGGISAKAARLRLNQPMASAWFANGSVTLPMSKALAKPRMGASSG